MIQLSYQPAYDPFHSTFRLIRIFLANHDLEWSFDQLRIVDFYVAFPDLIQTIRGMKTKAKKYKLLDLPKPYSERPSPQKIFYQMWPIQQAALQTACIKGFVKFHSDPMNSKLSLRVDAVPEKLIAQAEKRNDDEASLMEFILAELYTMELKGGSGLKQRSGLMEYRYDGI